MRRQLRAFFECTHDRESHLTLDIIVGDNRHLVPRIPMCGWWGRLQSDDFWPLVWTKDGRLDLGNSEGEPIDPEDRYAYIDIEDRILAEGEFFEMRFNTNHYRMVLKKLTDLTEA